MTDAETETTAQLLREINQHAFGGRGRARHGLRARARRQGDGAARGLGAGRGLARPGAAPIRASSKSIWGGERCSQVQNVDLYYGAAQALRGVSLSARRSGEVTCLLGRNGVGKTSLLRAIFGLQPIAPGSIRWDGQDISRLPPYERARRGIALVPQGREIFPLLTVKENLETGFAPVSREQQEDPRRGVRAVPGAEVDAAPARRRSVGRPAAAARDRPRAHHAAQAAGARRADRGHPALDHQGHRPRHRLPAPARRHGDPAGRAVSRFRPRAGRRFRGHGPRRGRDVGHPRDFRQPRPCAVT